MLPARARAVLALVPPDQEVLKQIAQELQRDILEGKGRPMEQLQQVEVLAPVEGDDRRDLLSAERRIAAPYDLP